MTPYYQDDAVTIHHGDCLDVLRELPDGSVDAVVTDPPYDLTSGKKGGTGAASVNLDSPYGRSRIGTGNGAGGFMGQAWDATGVAFDPATWVEVLRVLKPGGHMLAFGGSRTWHRLAAAVEDAGFEIRDSIFWIYGSGFPKSLNVSKDARFCQCELVESSHADTPLRGMRSGISSATSDGSASEGADLFPPMQREATRGCASGESLRLDGAGAAAVVRRGEPGMEGRRDAEAAEGQLSGSAVRPLPGGVLGDGAGGRLRDGAPSRDGAVGRSRVAAVGSGESQGSRPVEQRADEPRTVSVERGSQAGRGWPLCAGCGKPRVPAGLGTALKPAAEPIVVGRKPLAGTVAANVLAHGTGALNVDGCRVAGETVRTTRTTALGVMNDDGWVPTPAAFESHPSGRWPTNVVLDDTQAAALDAQSGALHTQDPATRRGTSDARGVTDFRAGNAPCYDDRPGTGASRFFPTFRYEAKAPTAERPRDGNTAHPTVKPLDLMRWLVRLVTPPGGVVLDPFLGSGTTAEACVLEHFRCIGIEREAAYLPLAVARLSKPLHVGFDFGEVSA